MKAFRFNAVDGLILVVMFVLAGCGGGDNPQAQTATPTTAGRKIFLTSKTHNGNFYGDPTLFGATAINKADNFCQTDPARPTIATYKAFLIDGIYRSAVPSIDWVLKPNTAYYKPFGDSRIGLTNSGAVFSTANIHLENSIGDSVDAVWTGTDGSSRGLGLFDCQSWSSSQNNINARVGIASETNVNAFAANDLQSCASELRLYCVEQ